MKHILVSADSKPSVYLVPDIVADNLRDFCLDFLSDLYNMENDRDLEIIDNEHVTSDDESTLCFDETGFIYWLNQYKFPDEPSMFVETLDWEAFEGVLPENYKSCPWFNF